MRDPRYAHRRSRFRNARAAAAIGLDRLGDADRIAHFGRFEALPDDLPKPLAEQGGQARIAAVRRKGEA